MTWNGWRFDWLEFIYKLTEKLDIQFLVFLVLFWEVWDECKKPSVMWVFSPGEDTKKCRKGSKFCSKCPMCVVCHSCGVTGPPAGPILSTHLEAAFINTAPLTPSKKQKKKRKRNRIEARALEPSSCCLNFSGLICINKEAVPCRNVFYPAQKISGRSLSVEHWENPTVRADKTNESWCQRRVAPRWQIEKNCPSVDRHASFSN